MRRKKNTKRKKRFIGPLPDHRNVPRGVEYIAKIIEGIETGRKPDDVIQEMSIKKDRNLLNQGDNEWDRHGAKDDVGITQRRMR